MIPCRTIIFNRYPTTALCIFLAGSANNSSITTIRQLGGGLVCADVEPVAFAFPCGVFVVVAYGGAGCATVGAL